MIKSINQIRIELSEIQASHRQLNSFFWGDILRAYKENELNYPLMLGFYPNGTMLRNQTQIQLTISIADKVYKDWSNLNEVESDTLQICRDVFNVINHSTRWQTIGRVQSCSVTKFIDRTGDEVAGHTMTMQFLIRDSSSICDLPMFDYDFDQITGDECLPVQIYENGILVATVPSGGTYEYFHGDAHYIITDTDGNVLYSGDIAENDTLNQTITDSVATLQNSALTVLSTTNILAEGTATITAPDATATIKNTAGTTIATEAIPSGATEIVTITDSALTINSASIGSVAAEAGLDIVVNLDGAPSGSWDGNSWEVTSAACANTTLEVNGTIEGTVIAGSTVDVQLSDSLGTVTPTTVTQVGNDLQIVLPDAPIAVTRSTATLMKTGQTTSYRTGDDGDLEAGRATDFLTLDAAPVHNDNTATLNTTTSRFTDTLGGSTYANDIILDWSTWNGSTILGYYRVSIGSGNWNTSIDNALTTSIGAFTSGWRLINIREAGDITNYGLTSVFNYSPFNIAVGFWTSSTYAPATSSAWISATTGIHTSSGKSNSRDAIAVRIFSLSTLNVLS